MVEPQDQMQISTYAKPLTIKVLQNLIKFSQAAADSALMLIEDCDIEEEKAVAQELEGLITRLKTMAGQSNLQRIIYKVMEEEKKEITTPVAEPGLSAQDKEKLETLERETYAGFADMRDKLTGMNNFIVQLNGLKSKIADIFDITFGRANVSKSLQKSEGKEDDREMKVKKMSTQHIHPYASVYMCTCQYEGETIDGKPHGYGEMMYNSPIFGNSFRVCGQFENGLLSGSAVMWIPEQDLFSYSTYSMGRKEGYGRSYYNGNPLYIGNYKDSQRHGSGKYIEAYGVIFEGTFYQGLKQEGVLVSRQGEKYSQVYDSKSDLAKGLEQDEQKPIQSKKL